MRIPDATVSSSFPLVRRELMTYQIQSVVEEVLQCTESVPTTPPSRSNLGLKLRHLVSSATKRRASKNDSMDISSIDNTMAPRPHIPSTKLSPVQRLKLAATRRMHSAAAAAQEASACSEEQTPACLDSETAELHRKAVRTRLR